MITEHARVVLTAPVPKERLEIGDVGTVVHVYQDGNAFEVEFTAQDGQRNRACRSVKPFETIVPTTWSKFIAIAPLRAAGRDRDHLSCLCWR